MDTWIKHISEGSTKNCKRCIKKIRIENKGKGTQLYFTLTYRPELDITHFCDPEQHNIFMMIVGMMRWLIELGRIDILLETSQLSSYLASPRIGYLIQTLRVFHYRMKHDSSWIPMDYTPLDIEYTGPQDASPEVRRKMMRQIYRDTSEKIPDNEPTIRGKEVQLNVYVDTDHT